MTMYLIFNDLSGRYLATLDDKYLSFATIKTAEAYMEKRGLNPEYFRIVRRVKK